MPKTVPGCVSDPIYYIKSELSPSDFANLTPCKNNNKISKSGEIQWAPTPTAMRPSATFLWPLGWPRDQPYMLWPGSAAWRIVSTCISPTILHQPPQTMLCPGLDPHWPRWDEGLLRPPPAGRDAPLPRVNLQLVGRPDRPVCFSLHHTTEAIPAHQCHEQCTMCTTRRLVFSVCRKCGGAVCREHHITVCYHETFYCFVPCSCWLIGNCFILVNKFDILHKLLVILFDLY